MCFRVERWLVWSLIVGACLTGAGCGQAPQPVDSKAAADGAVGSAAVVDGADQRVGSPQDLDSILKKYVKGDYFDYGGLKQNAADLATFAAFMHWQSEADVKSMTREDQIAFYINAYNSCCIQAILDHYPVHSPMDIDGFFDKLTFRVGGETLKIGGSDGDSIEYDRLIANYKDMRAHFAVVCADRGCLPLKAGAYTGKSLNADLEAAARKFVSDERQFKLDTQTKQVQIAKIFEWYGPKFLQDPQRPVQGGRPELYLLNWLPDDSRKLLESGDYKLKIIEWNWTINEKS